jgi:cell fate (sporulation/competence/biofilm development) regulator YlbF (YheA/YmcA/DUF963 family)
MAVYDKAYELANDLKQSSEYQQYIQVKREVDAEPMTKKMLLDFMKKQFELQSIQLRGEQVSADEMEKFKKLAELIQMNRTAVRYIEAEQRIAVLIQDVQRILIEGMEIGYKEVFEQ